jgi:glycosyltransferase involved in cell wall biosynthesis
MTNSNFTVLISVFKKDDPTLFYLALKSIFENSMLPSRVLVIADGPLTNELNEILNLYSSHSSLFIIRLEVNEGLSSALNVGLRTIDTEFTIRADSDDFNSPNRFVTLIKLLESGYDLVGSSIIEVDKSGTELAIRRPPLNQVDIRKFAKKRNPFNHMSIAFRTIVVTGIGGYPNIFLKEDYALWATLISKGVPMCNSDEILVRATTGRDFYKRRGGLRYAFAEIAMQKHLVSCGLKNPFSALFDGVLRSIVFLAPGRVREFVYVNFLRQGIK